jgi:hypothetical protein
MHHGVDQRQVKACEISAAGWIGISSPRIRFCQNDGSGEEMRTRI